MKMVGFAFVFCLLVSGNVLYGAESALTTTFIDDLCYNTKFVEYNLKYEPSGILMGVPRNQGPFECEVVFVPPQGASVVLSIHRYDLYADDVLTIEDSDRHRVALMGYGVFKDEKKSVISEGKLRIRYKTNGNNTDNRRAGFQFTFTRALKSPCNSNEFKCANEHCIQKSYVCDGHNHCGDLSDQKKCNGKEPQVDPNVPQQVNRRSLNSWVALLSIAVGVVAAVIVVTIIVLKCKSSKKKATNKLMGKVIESVREDYQTNCVPLEIVSSPSEHRMTSSREQIPTSVSHSSSNSSRQNLQTVSANVPEHRISTVQKSNAIERVQPRVESVQKEQSPAPGVHLGSSMYPRLEKARKERNVEPKMYQVPSMYPTLDQIPSAPELEGVENPDFQLEE